MKRHAYTLTLLDDTIISRRAATLGGHQSLDYLPGQTLLGACAARLYRKLGSDSYRVFHSGQLRFGNARPLAGGQPGWPLPLCWHQKKTDPALANGRLDARKIWNLSRTATLPDKAQPKQLRDGYIDAAGQLHRPSPALRMKTAINPDTRRAADGQLFGYQAIPRGSRFGGWIEADPQFPDPLFQQVIDALRGELLVGRSRSAEYGRARFDDADFQPPAAGPAETGQSATLWLLADLAVQDPHGQPSLEPQPHYLGLPPGEVVWERSFIRSRSYSPWNGKRGAPDLERSVIQQGSVIHYRFDQPLAGDSLGKACATGLGLHREAGLGRVWLNPPLLATEQPQFTASSTASAASTRPERPASALIDWLHRRQQGDSERNAIEDRASKLFRNFQYTRILAALLLGRSADADFGPSAAQWSRVGSAAAERRGDDLLRALFEGDNASVKPTAEGWQEQYLDANGQRHTLADWLQTRLRKVPAGQRSRVTQRLAHRCREAQTHRGAPQ